MLHVSVLAAEVMELLQVREGDTVVDVTAGAGGHLALLAEAVGPRGRVIALDRDERAHRDDAAGGVAKRYADRVTLELARFSELEEVLRKHGVAHVDALLADLGVSSMQFDDAERGFSFQKDGPLDMRMGDGETCYELIARLSEAELADVLFHYGDERKSRRVARGIKYVWPIEDSTLALAAVISRSLGGRTGRIHPATRSFQALRIATNRELDELDALLDALPRVLADGGRAAVISFHSLEDRKVKRCFADKGSRAVDGSPAAFEVLTRRPVVPGEEERSQNPRSRSAKLRAVRRCPR